MRLVGALVMNGLHAKLFNLGAVLALLSLVGCKLQIAVPQGGIVTTTSGSYECLSSRVCNIDVSDTYFDETFIATPDPGYIFLGWESSDKGFCGDKFKKDRPCHLFTTGFPESDTFSAILDSDEVFYLTPIFVRGTPIAEAVNGIVDTVFRECVQSWVGNATYAEEVKDIRCIPYIADAESLEGIQAFRGLRKLMLNAWKYDLAPLSELRYLEYLRLYVHPDEDFLPLKNLMQLDHLEIGIFRHESTCATYAGTQWRCSGLGFRNFASLASLKKVKFLNLAFDNPDLETVGKLTSLKTLYAHSGNITDISELSGLTKLTFLDLQNNQIVDISALDKMIHLEKLNLAGNQIDDCSALSGLKNLEVLFLNGNKLRDITALRGLKLAALGLSQNQISDISPLAELRNPNPPPNNYTTLDLRNNRIKLIGNALGSIERGDIHLEGNPLFCSEIDEYLASKPLRVEVSYSGCVEG